MLNAVSPLSPFVANDLRGLEQRVKYHAAADTVDQFVRPKNQFLLGLFFPALDLKQMVHEALERVSVKNSIDEETNNLPADGWPSFAQDD